MIQATSEPGIDAVSPIARSSKHQTTPSRLRRKFSRKDQGADIHSSCSTPIRMQVEAPSSSFSPDAFPCSQENRPEVIWDYTSPNLPKGASKKELKITVEEFLKNLTQHQAPECNTQGSRYIKLLETWKHMQTAKQNTPVCVKKPLKNVKRDSKVRSRRLYEDIQKLITSIQQEKDEATEENNSKEMNAAVNENNLASCSNTNQINNSVSKKSFLEGDTNDNDSMEDLWGEMDNSFIIKATQHLDGSCSFVAEKNNYNIESTIPETVTSTSYQTKSLCETEETVNKNSLNKAMIDSDYQAQILLSQVMSCDWDSDSENEDLENGFIMGDDALSLIPDEMLCGAESTSSAVKNKNRSNCGKSSDKEVMCNKVSTNSECGGKELEDDKFSCELTFGCSESDTVASQAAGQSEIELFNNFEDESFGDESILCKPEVLSWIDEVESKLSQSQKCTPEEIEKKKDEAIQRKKRNQQKT